MGVVGVAEGVYGVSTDGVDVEDAISDYLEGVFVFISF